LVILPTARTKEKAMAKKPEPQSFMDVFANFGRDLKMPNMDIEKIMDHNRKNLEALEKSAKASAAGASALVAKQREALQDALREFADLAQSYRIPGNPQEMVEKQAEFARKAFETAVKNAGEVADIVRKSGTDSLEILRERIQEAMEDVRKVYEDRK
jgi:phasin family protein